MIVEYLSPPLLSNKSMEFVHPTLGTVYVEEITHAPFFEVDYADYVKGVDNGGSSSDGSYWGHT